MRWLRNHTLEVTVQDGGKTGAKTGIKLAYKHAFAPVFTSDGHPLLLVRPWPGKKMCRPELLPYRTHFIIFLLDLKVETCYDKRKMTKEGR